MESEVVFDRTGKGIKSDPKTVAEDRSVTGAQ
jgi:hypothetical protein